MSSDLCPLAEIATIQGGYAFKSGDFGNEGFAVVKIANIQPPTVSILGADRVRRESVEGLERFELNDGDVLMAMTGATVGKVGRFRRTEPAYLNQRVARISARQGKAFDDFVYAVLSLPGFDSQIENTSAGSAQANISAAGIGSVLIRRTPDKEQLQIGAIARSLDDRIALLRETNATLEAIAQALFKSWFVDFDPVHAKQEGIAPAGMDEATAALFPDSFEESVFGSLPSGWRVGTVSDFAQLHRGSVNPGLRPDTWFDHFSLPAFDEGRLPIREQGSKIKSNKTSVPAQAVLVSKLNPHIPRVWLPVDVGPDAVCSTEFLVFMPVGNTPREFTYGAVTTAPFQERLRQLATGTSNSHQRVKPESVLSLGAVLPPEQIQKTFATVVSALFEQIGQSQQRAQTLATLRDTLLPRLISGQLRLPEAPAELEAAA